MTDFYVNREINMEKYITFQFKHFVAQPDDYIFTLKYT